MNVERRPLTIVAFFIGLALIGSMRAADWRSGLTADPPGSFAPPRPLHATYRFGWSGFTAATANVNFTRRADSRFSVEGTGRTTGLVRTLWKFDVSLAALAESRTLHPIETKQTEKTRSKTVFTHLAFDSRGVTRSRKEGQAEPKLTRFDFPNLYDLQSAVLYVRSQPLTTDSVQRIAVYPTTSPYLATITVTGREKVSVAGKSYNAIKLDLNLNKIDKNLQLQPHRKFRHATGWISDDADRLLLRVTAQIFVGSVFLELQSVKFDEARP